MGTLVVTFGRIPQSPRSRSQWHAAVFTIGLVGPCGIQLIGEPSGPDVSPEPLAVDLTGASRMVTHACTCPQACEDFETAGAGFSSSSSAIRHQMMYLTRLVGATWFRS